MKNMNKKEYNLGDTITWKSLGTGKVRTGYISAIRGYPEDKIHQIKAHTRFEVKNQYGDTWTVSEEEIQESK